MCWPTRTTSRNDGNGFRLPPGSGRSRRPSTGDVPTARAGPRSWIQRHSSWRYSLRGCHLLGHRPASRSVTPNPRGPSHTPFAAKQPEGILSRFRAAGPGGPAARDAYAPVRLDLCLPARHRGTRPQYPGDAVSAREAPERPVPLQGGPSEAGAWPIRPPGRRRPPGPRRSARGAPVRRRWGGRSR